MTAPESDFNSETDAIQSNLDASATDSVASELFEDFAFGVGAAVDAVEAFGSALITETMGSSPLAPPDALGFAAAATGVAAVGTESLGHAPADLESFGAASVHSESFGDHESFGESPIVGESFGAAPADADPDDAA